MSNSMKTRFKTGDKCPSTSHYKFDRYVDGTTTPSPTKEEERIPLENGETFPPIRSSEKACYWIRD